MEAAPLLCGALIGYRALRLAGDAPRLGLYGFGSAGHMVAQVARHLGREVWAGAFDVEVDDPDITQLGGPGDERVEQHRGRRRRAVDPDLFVRLYAGDGLCGRDDAHWETLRLGHDQNRHPALGGNLGRD